VHQKSHCILGNSSKPQVVLIKKSTGLNFQYVPFSQEIMILFCWTHGMLLGSKIDIWVSSPEIKPAENQSSISS